MERRESVIDECVGEGSEVIDPLTLSYRDHRDVLRNAMEDLGWPCPQTNFDLLEAEIKKAETFMKYSAKLREENRRGSRPQSSSGTGEGGRKSRSLSRTEDDGKRVASCGIISLWGGGGVQMGYSSYSSETLSQSLSVCHIDHLF